MTTKCSQKVQICFNIYIINQKFNSNRNTFEYIFNFQEKFPMLTMTIEQSQHQEVLRIFHSAETNVSGT